MHYVFIDESYSKSSEKYIVVSAWAVEQGRLNAALDLVASLQEAGKAPIIDRINLAFERLDASAIIGKGEFTETAIKPGEVDRCDDIPAMMRTDSAWSMATMFVVAKLVRDLAVDRKGIDAVDLYFDPKTLRPAHESAWMESTRNLLGKGIRSLSAELGIAVSKQARIRRIEFVPKPARGGAYEKLQLGTWVADRLCAKSIDVSADSFSKIKTMNMGDAILRTVQQWDGVSFYRATVSPVGLDGEPDNV